MLGEENNATKKPSIGVVPLGVLDGGVMDHLKGMCTLIADGK